MLGKSLTQRERVELRPSLGERGGNVDTMEGVLGVYWGKLVVDKEGLGEHVAGQVRLGLGERGAGGEDAATAAEP